MSESIRVTMLGTGAALADPDRGHSSILVTAKDQHYLLDIGHGATRQLVRANAVSYTHLRAHETVLDLVCRLLL